MIFLQDFKLFDKLILIKNHKINMEWLQGNYEQITNSSIDITWSNILTINNLNKSISEKFVQNWNSDVKKIAVNIEEGRKTLENNKNNDKNNIIESCKFDIQDMKFQRINENFWNSQILTVVYQELKSELNMDITKNLWMLDNYIINELRNPDWFEMDIDDYSVFIENIRTIIIVQFKNISKEIHKLKLKNWWSLENLQWAINESIQSWFENIRTSVLTSAKYYLEIQNPETKNNISEKIWKTHINMRERQIREAFIDKKLLIDEDTGWFDFAEENTTTKEINKIPTDIINNDSFFTLDNIKNEYRDLYLVKNDINNDGISIWKWLSHLKNISVLSEKDQETETEFLIATLAVDAFASIPWAWSLLSLWIATQDIFSDYDVTIENIKKLFPDFDQSYMQQNSMEDYVLAVWTIGISLVWLQWAIKWLKIASQVKYLKWLNISAELIQQTFNKVWLKFGFSVDQIAKLLDTESKVINLWDKIMKEEKRSHKMNEYT